MSLEKNIEILTEAVKELTAIVTIQAALQTQPVEVTATVAEDTFADIPATQPATPVPETPVVVQEPVYVMTEAAGGFTREQMIDANWTNETLLRDGMMVCAEVVPETPAPAAGLIPEGTPATHIDNRQVLWSAEFHSAEQSRDKNGNFKAKRQKAELKAAFTVALNAYEAPFLLPAVAPAPAAPFQAPPGAGTLLTETEANDLNDQMVEVCKNLGSSEPVKALMVKYGVNNTSELTRDQADDLLDELDKL